MQKALDNRLDNFVQAQIAEIDFIHDYKTIRLPDLSFEEFVFDRQKYFHLNNIADRYYYLNNILPRLKLLYFDESNNLTIQYLVWVGGEHRQLVSVGEYKRFYIGEGGNLLGMSA